MTYVPYFRGKQFDLAALKEAVTLDLLPPTALPLIEPVRDTNHLRRTLEAFIKKQRQALVILNPEVGQARLGATKLHPIDDLLESPYIIPAYILNEDFRYEWVTHSEYVFISKRYIRDLEEILAEFIPLFHLISDSARLRKLIDHNRILLTDPFTRLKSNADYLELPDEFFSDEHKFFHEDGYMGYSDFGIDGSAYWDKGYPSRAIALHILYVDKFGSLRIKHFASDSNDTATNPAGKFFEALEKLYEWHQRYRDVIPLTYGLGELLKYRDTGKYPGSGVIKKLSVLHQLEIIGSTRSESI